LVKLLGRFAFGMMLGGKTDPSQTSCMRSVHAILFRSAVDSKVLTNARKYTMTRLAPLGT